MDRSTTVLPPTVTSNGTGSDPLSSSPATPHVDAGAGPPPPTGSNGPRRGPRQRLADLTVRQRLTAHALVLVAVPLAIMMFVGLTTTSGLITDAEERELDRIATALHSDVDASALRASTLATGLATTPAVAEAFADRDRDALAAEILPTFERLHAEHGVAQLQFHEPRATSFLRAHEPDAFGDDLSGFRATVVTANADRDLVTGLEAGRFGLGLRAVVPVSWQDEHVGTVEVGNEFGSGFFTRFAQANDVEVALFLTETDAEQGGSGFTTYASTVGDQPPVSTEALRSVLQGAPLVERIDAAGSSLTARFDPMLDFSGTAIGVSMVAVPADVAQTLWRTEALTYGVLALVLLTGGGIVSWLFARDLARPIVGIREVLDHARNGDLSHRVEIERQDEIGAIGHEVNATFDRLSVLLTEVEDNAQTLAAAADEMSVVSEQLEGNATETAEEAASATDAARNVSANVDSIASASRQMSAAIAEIAQNASVATNVAGRGVAVTDETVAAMEALSRSSQEIEQVVTLISEIAGQTHLLALNANIEAARAGESGRAFAVVANEIGNLARRTAAESETIADRIHDIGRHTDSSIACMSAVTETMHEISSLQNSIASAVEEQSATTAEIGRTVSDAAGTSASIAASMASVTERIDETRQAAGNSSTAALELRKVAAGLHASMSHYTDS